MGDLPPKAAMRAGGTLGCGTIGAARRYSQNLWCYWLAASKHIHWHCSRRNLLVAVMNIVDMRYIDEALDVGDISDIGDVHLAQIPLAVVIPRKERLAWSEREPRLHADFNPYRKSSQP